jgi:hypothetical protein
MKRLLVVSLVFLAAEATSSASRLLLTVPPIVKNGHAYVPARQWGDWLGASIQWDGRSRGIRVNWRGREESWSVASGSVLLRRGMAYLRLRDFAAAFGAKISWRFWRDRERVVDFGERARSTYAAIPLGWTLPTMPRGLSPDQRRIWPVVAAAVHTGSVEGSVHAIGPIRVVGRWASAEVRPLNVVTDDAWVFLERRHGGWQVIFGPGTDFGPDGRNRGIPSDVMRRLQAGS